MGIPPTDKGNRESDKGEEMNYIYIADNIAQTRLYRKEPPNTIVGIALYNHRKKRIYIHDLEALTDNDVNAIADFIKIMRDREKK